jgi:S1-C subfamily serine protease
MSHVDDEATSADPLALTRPVIDAEPITGQQQAIAAPPSGRVDGGAASPERRKRGQRRSEWRRAEKARRYAARYSVRFPVFTRSILLWLLLFALTGVAFGVSGAFWWANFNTQVSDLRNDTQDFEARSTDAQSEIEDARTQAVGEIETALAPLRGFLSETQMLQLGQQFSPAVQFVATLDEQGLPSVGTGFAVITDDRQTFYVTSYNTVKAATVAPGPEIMLRKGADEVKGELWNWDPDHDLALVRADIPNQQVLEWVDDAAAAKAVSTRIFPISGLGGAGSSLTTGTVIDQSSVGFQHDAPLGTAWQGGPIVDVEGKVLGVASLAYAPLGFPPGDQVHFAVSANELCRTLLSCGGGGREAGPRN